MVKANAPTFVTSPVFRVCLCILAIEMKYAFQRLYRSIVFGPPGNTKGALLFFVVNMLCWAYPMYIFKVSCHGDVLYTAEEAMFVAVNFICMRTIRLLYRNKFSCRETPFGFD